jgi:hypothetical protein
VAGGRGGGCGRWQSTSSILIVVIIIAQDVL